MKIKNYIKFNIDDIKSELIRMHPKDGDVFILNIDTDDVEYIYSTEMSENITNISEIITDIVGFEMPVLVFGNNINMSLLPKKELIKLLTDDILESVITKLDDESVYLVDLIEEDEEEDENEDISVSNKTKSNDSTQDLIDIFD